MCLNEQELYELIEKVQCANQVPSVDIYCSSSFEEYLKEHWVEKAFKANIHSVPYDMDNLYVIPTKELEKPIKFVLPERKYELWKYLGFESEEEL